MDRIRERTGGHKRERSESKRDKDKLLSCPSEVRSHPGISQIVTLINKSENSVQLPDGLCQ